MSRSTGRTGPRDPRRTTTRQPPLEGKDLAERPEFKAVSALVEKDGPIIEQMAWLADWQREWDAVSDRLKEAARGSKGEKALLRKGEALVTGAKAFKNWVQGVGAKPSHPGGGKTQTEVVKRRLVFDYLRFGEYRGPSGSSSLSRPESLWSQARAKSLDKFCCWGGADKRVKLIAWKAEREWYLQPWPPADDKLKAELATASQATQDGPLLPFDIPLDTRHLVELAYLLAGVLAQLTVPEKSGSWLYQVGGWGPGAVANPPHMIEGVWSPSTALAELCRDREFVKELQPLLPDLQAQLRCIAPVLLRAVLEHFSVSDLFPSPPNGEPPTR